MSTRKRQIHDAAKVRHVRIGSRLRMPGLLAHRDQ